MNYPFKINTYVKVKLGSLSMPILYNNTNVHIMRSRQKYTVDIGHYCAQICDILLMQSYFITPKCSVTKNDAADWLVK